MLSTVRSTSVYSVLTASFDNGSLVSSVKWTPHLNPSHPWTLKRYTPPPHHGGGAGGGGRDHGMGGRVGWRARILPFRALLCDEMRWNRATLNEFERGALCFYTLKCPEAVS